MLLWSTVSTVLCLEHIDWVLMTFQDKGTDEADYKEVHQIVLKGMAQNMSVLVKEGNIGAITCDHAAQENFYVVQFLSDPYTLRIFWCTFTLIKGGAKIALHRHFFVFDHC